MTDTQRGFGADRLALIADIEAWHFWFEGRRRLVSDLLRRVVAPGGGRVLDIGCGTGAMSRHLAGLGYRTVGVDPLAGARTPASGQVSLVRGDARALPVASGSCAAVLLLDVLEHTDDARALGEAHRVLGPAGVSILAVPALPWLWSVRDDKAGHLRRYTRRGVLDLVDRAGFVVERWTGYQCLLLPAVALSRWRARRRRSALAGEEAPGPLINRLFGLVNRMELSLGRFVRWPIGSSLVVQCRRSRPEGTR